MLDISDGLLRDGDAAGSGQRRRPRPRSGRAEAAGRRRCCRPRTLLGMDPLDWVLGGGEDHGLLATFPPGRSAASRIHCDRLSTSPWESTKARASKLRAGPRTPGDGITLHTKVAANAQAMKRWLGKAETALGNHSDRLNAINIFPVADGDTGTNLYLTVRAAAQARHVPPAAGRRRSGRDAGADGRRRRPGHRRPGRHGAGPGKLGTPFLSFPVRRRRAAGRPHPADLHPACRSTQPRPDPGLVGVERPRAGNHALRHGSGSPGRRRCGRRAKRRRQQPCPGPCPGRRGRRLPSPR